jgi:hypothetical protein
MQRFAENTQKARPTFFQRATFTNSFYYLTLRLWTHPIPSSFTSCAIMSANSTPTSILITDQKTISSYNRGPITSVFAPPASCTATLTFTDGNPGALFFGHFAGPFDKGCYPTGTDSAQPLQKTGAWNAYYCTQLLHHCAKYHN